VLSALVSNFRLSRLSLEDAANGLKEYLKNVLEPRNSDFSYLNPIDKVVAAASNDNGVTVSCMIEACSGSGKSLCAADYFSRHPTTSLYFVFEYVHEQEIYSRVQDLTCIMNAAIDLDLKQYVFSTNVFKIVSGESTEISSIKLAGGLQLERSWHTRLSVWQDHNARQGNSAASQDLDVATEVVGSG